MLRSPWQVGGSVRAKRRFVPLPIAGQYNAAFFVIGSPDDLGRPITLAGEHVGQLVAGIATVGEDMAQPRTEPADGGEHVGRRLRGPGCRRHGRRRRWVPVRVGEDVTTCVAASARAPGIAHGSEFGLMVIPD